MTNDNHNNQAMDMLNSSISGLCVTGLTSGNYEGMGVLHAVQPYNTQQSGSISLWNYWQNLYYPQVIRESYPIYIQEKAIDKGKLAFEILKSLMDKKLVNLEKVSDFVEAMDTILKTL